MTGSGQYSFQQVQALFADFSAMMRTRRIPLRRDSHLQRAMDEMTRFLDRRAGTSPIVPEPDHDCRIRRMLGAFTLIKAIMSVAASPLFPKLVPHLEAIAKAPHALIVQNERSEHPNDQTTNQMFELLMAAPMLRFAEGVELDHPGKSKGRPDMVVRVDGAVWAIECKTPFSPKPEQYRDRVYEAIEQLRKFACDRRLVFVSLRNLIEHRELFEQDGETFKTPDPIPLVRAEFDRILRTISEKTADDIPRHFDSALVEPWIFHYGATVGVVSKDGKRAMTPIEFLWPVQVATEHSLVFHSRLDTAMRDNYRQ